MDKTINELLADRIKKSHMDNMSGPFSVAFTVTSKCNYRCRHCYNNSGENIYKDMTDKELINVTKQIAEMEPVSVCLCGGEPLVRGEILFEVINILVPRCGVVNIVSNGYMIDEKILDRLKTSGINTIQVSLDGNTEFLHDNMRCKAGAFLKAIKAIKLASEYGFKVAVSFCPHKINFTNVEETAKLVKNLGANEFRIMPLITMGRGKNMKKLQMTADEYLWLQQTICIMQKKYQGKNFQVVWGDPLDHIYRMPENSRNNMSTYSMEIRSDGKLMLSSYLPIVCGDIKYHTLKEYWDAGYNNIWQNNKIKFYIENLFSTNQFGNYNPEPYTGNDIKIDLL